MRYVFLDPDGTADDWLYVIVRAKTGITYEQQYGGTACRQGKVEGYLVPVYGTEALAELCDLFERTLQGAGTWDHDWPEERLRVLREAVGKIRYWATDEPAQLVLDESRPKDFDEAWLPVITPDGPGVLMWSNSD